MVQGFLEVWRELKKLFPQLQGVEFVRKCVITCEVHKAPTIELESFVMLDGNKTPEVEVRKFGLVEIGQPICERGESSSNGVCDVSDVCSERAEYVRSPML